MRPQPVPSPPFGEAAKRVGGDEFSDQRALIVGGSRGLGAAAALLLAAGGGLPIVTFASGQHEAHALRREIRGQHGRIETVGLDVTDTDAPSIVAGAARRFDVTHVYYFATPRIFARRQSGAFDSALFAQFAAMYVDAFANVCCAAHRDGRPLDVFYPSSDAVVETPLAMTEYAAAKAAGEWLCAALERSRPGLHVLVSRLPRTATDQTASILPIAAASPLDVMLPVVREMHRRGRSRTA
jgi:NAD(P)-dependent dehydrogenase (short-subunit alcohol dehydrogenase family)